jgi:hypothetical protein
MRAVLGKLYRGTCPPLLLAVADRIGWHPVGNGKVALKMKVRRNAGECNRRQSPICLSGAV